MKLTPPLQVELGGPLGDALQRGVARIHQPPYADRWILADVSFEVDRAYTNYSGDISGRFLELAALTSRPGQRQPAVLGPVMAGVARYQKSDGHFGVEVDLTKPLANNSPPIPMLWGNARLLVGLVVAAQAYDDPELLAAAKRLGDFYVNTAELLCSPNRDEEYRASGSGAGSYTCCYLPAIEGLAMLYAATKDERYLKQAERVAEQLRKCDSLPIDHSHGNLCAWRGVLQLYEATGKREYLDRARDKWAAAMSGGFVWPTGGMGEHWYVSFGSDEGCSESDWVRFCLDLWRFTGEVRYLDAAERLLWNQYLSNQGDNGGFGARCFVTDAAGPVAISSTWQECSWCCSLHGPLGLHFLKSYLATGSDQGVFVNFPMDFNAPVKAADREWRVSTTVHRDDSNERARMEIELAPQAAGDSKTTLWVRVPNWASGVEEVRFADKTIAPSVQNGYLRIDGDFRAGEKVLVVFQARLRLEDRRFHGVHPEPGKFTVLRDVSILSGPEVLLASSPVYPGRRMLWMTVDKVGRLGLLRHDAAGYATAMLSKREVSESEAVSAIDAADAVLLRPWRQSTPRHTMAMVHDVVVMPAEAIPVDTMTRFLGRAENAAKMLDKSFFGDNLEERPEAWTHPGEWKFTPEGLQVFGGNVGLLDGEPYTNYRFEFDVVLPKEGAGLTAWVVRARIGGDMLMYQLQGEDSDPKIASKPNSLRPHVCRNDRWTAGDPVPLPKSVRRGEVHRVAVECRDDTIEVFLDGQKIHTQTAGDLRSGGVGFRVANPAEQGLFRRISLKQL